jgi:murein DD-endopeptidase MepM/ murein hydrolase activator NlpD
MHKISIFLLTIGLLLLSTVPVTAQDKSSGATYIVQSGDTLSTISSRFSVSVDDLIQTNNISNPDAITSGMELIIPGIQGIQGKLTTQTVQLGESLQNISIMDQIPLNSLIKINRITSPSEIYAGSNLIIPVNDKNSNLVPQQVTNTEISILESAIINKQNPWMLIKNNELANSWNIANGDTIYVPVDSNNQISNGVSPLIKKIEISPLPLSQGKTVEVKIKTTGPLNLTGSLSGNQLNFYQLADNNYLAFSGIDALAEPGVTPFIINGATQDGKNFDYEQSVLLTPGQFSQDPPLEVDPATLKEDVRQAEDQQIKDLTQKSTPVKYWSDEFIYPIDEPCIRSWFGNRRSYNGGVYKSYHGGVDFGVCANNLNIYAPAPGKVVFVGPLNVHGNTTIIDHGWGIYTFYSHQSEMNVNVGDQVEAGQIIGQIGKTGRVSGPHLHFEIRVNGIPVDPLDWLENQYPSEK